jgi:hypothetical protein
MKPRKETAMNRLRFGLFVVLVAGLAGCATGTNPQAYLNSDGKLAQPLDIRQSQVAGGVGTTKYIWLEVYGKWTMGTIIDSSTSHKDDVKGTGILTKDEIAQVAKVLAKHDLATLPSAGKATAHSAEISIHFGKIKSRLLNNEQIELGKRYIAIVEGVREIIQNSAAKK